jgi:hypothetical protein
MLIHCFMGSMGADWDLESAVKLVRRSDDVAWIDNLFSHNLGVLADGRVHCFDARKPEPTPPTPSQNRSEPR